MKKIIQYLKNFLKTDEGRAVVRFFRVIVAGAIIYGTDYYLNILPSLDPTVKTAVLIGILTSVNKYLRNKDTLKIVNKIM